MAPMDNDEKWEWEISSKQKWYHLHLNELFQYKDLIISFFRRELLSGYHQSIIGVFWIVLQPVLTTLFYFVAFSRIVKVSTDHIPPVLFYMSGTIMWSFFSDCLLGTMYSFLHNAHIFNKVYFPRLVVPLSLLLNQAVKFGIQFILFLIVYIGYGVIYMHITPTLQILLIPLLLLQAGAFALGLGLILSVYVARYRDVEHIMQFVLRLFMFITPVFFPASIVSEKFRVLFWLNPMTQVIESFRTAFFNTGVLQTSFLLTGAVSSAVILFWGLILFKQKEIKVMDTI